MVTLFPFMVTLPELPDWIPSRAATPVKELEKLSLSAPPVTWFLILVPVPLNPRLPSVSEAEPFSKADSGSTGCTACELQPIGARGVLDDVAVTPEGVVPVFKLLTLFSISCRLSVDEI